jgi:hypothetical protein
MDTEIWVMTLGKEGWLGLINRPMLESIRSFLLLLLGSLWIIALLSQMLVKSTRRKRIAKLVAGLKTMLASKGKRRNESINSGGFQINGLARIDRSLAESQTSLLARFCFEGIYLGRHSGRVSYSFCFFLGKCFLVYNPSLTSESISGTSINGPITVANAAPDPMP